VEEVWAGVAETDLDWAVVLGSDWAAVAAGGWGSGGAPFEASPLRAWTWLAPRSSQAGLQSRDSRA
jgi:hypothetical protein